MPGKACSNCKAVLPDDAVFCGQCGATMGADGRAEVRGTPSYTPTSYVSQSLASGETIVYQGKLHPMVFAPGAFIAVPMFLVGLVASDATFTTVFFAFGLVALLPAFIQYTSTEFAVTTTRVVLKSGWLGQRTVELQLHKVEGLSVDQSFVGRAYGYGALIITGTGGTKERFDFLEDPHTFRQHVQEQIDRIAPTAGGLIPPPAPAPSAAVATERIERDCPWCAERILAKATRCRFCAQPVPPL